jgi:hypothetical protein
VEKEANINQIATLPVPERFIPMTNAQNLNRLKLMLKQILAVLGIIFPKLGHIQAKWCQQNNK